MKEQEQEHQFKEWLRNTWFNGGFADYKIFKRGVPALSVQEKIDCGNQAGEFVEGEIICDPLQDAIISTAALCRESEGVTLTLLQYHLAELLKAQRADFGIAE